MIGLMVVDDEAGVRRSLKRVLEKGGYRIVLAESGEEALAVIRKDGQGIEIVISDYRMPGMDGIETLAAIGRLNAEITRIILTGYATMTGAIEAVNSGIDGFLTKPFGNEELLAKVREYAIKKRLKQFVSEQVLGELQRNAEAILPRRMQVTVLFIDIRGFTGLSERLAPDELAELLNGRYFTPLDDIIFDHNGTLDKHIGDGIMAIFGAPISGADDARRAVLAALAMRREMARLNQGVIEPDRRIAVGIGIATGDAMAGLFGSPRKKEYTVFGAAVNLASRLEKLAQADQILICAETAGLLNGEMRLEKLDPAPVRGFTRPYEIFNVVEKAAENRSSGNTP